MHWDTSDERECIQEAGRETGPWRGTEWKIIIIIIKRGPADSRALKSMINKTLVSEVPPNCPNFSHRFPLVTE